MLDKRISFRQADPKVHLTVLMGLDQRYMLVASLGGSTLALASSGSDQKSPLWVESLLRLLQGRKEGDKEPISAQRKEARSAEEEALVPSKWMIASPIGMELGR